MALPFYAVLRAEVQNHLLADKRLLAPSLRVGRQWTQRLARLGVGLVNVHVTTLKRLAMELTDARRQKIGRQLLSRYGHRLLVEQIWREYCRDFPNRPWPSQSCSDALPHALSRTLFDLRMTGLTPADVRESELPEHLRQELADLLDRYGRALDEFQLIDEATLYDWAVSAILDSPSLLGADTRFLVPSNLRAEGLARRLVDQLPSDRRVWLSWDAAADSDTLRTNLERLRFLFKPHLAPPALKDQTVRLQRALDPAVEVDSVVRHALAEGLPLDQIEVLYSDPDTYVPLFLEKSAAWADEQVPGLEKGLPITFADGIALSWTRPGRALLGWLRWLEQDLNQAILLDLLADQLLSVPRVPRWKVSAWVRQMRVGWGKARWQKQLAEFKPVKPTDLGDEWPKVRDWVSELVQHAPAPDDTPLIWIEAAELLMQMIPPGRTDLDEQARHRLIGALRAMRSEHQRIAAGPRDMATSLSELVARTPVAGQGPKPGCLHVASIWSGGYSGRPCTFVLGLDEDHCRIAFSEDPLLRDSERRRLCPELATAQEQTEFRREELARKLSCLDGYVTFSFACRSLVEDEQIGPSEAYAAAEQLLQLSEKPPLLGFGPALGQPTLVREEPWWHLGGPRWPEAEGVNWLARNHPNWATGFMAERRRLSFEITPYDGWVPEAGSALGLKGNQPFLGSAKSLEVLGRCPLAFFFGHVLNLVPAEELPDPETDFLPGDLRGRVLHEFYQRVVTAITAGAASSRWDRDEALRLLREILEKYLLEHPPPSPASLEEEQKGLLVAALVFLTEEEQRHNQILARYAEVSIGFAGNQPQTDLDHPEPVSLSLDGGLQIRVQGRLDRIDEVVGPQAGRNLAAEESVGRSEFWIWDYKTGKHTEQFGPNNLRTGRLLQPFLYWLLATERLWATGRLPDHATASGFRYFFTADLQHLGDSYVWTQKEMQQGPEVLRRLLQLAHHGLFLATNDEKDCKRCAFRLICDVPAVTRATRLKLEACDSQDLPPESKAALAAWGDLRTGPRSKGDA
jgi:ATP-dependent helicase/nuclease subunit B